MILIVSRFGRMNKYPDQVMMRKTLAAFLRSLDNQTDKGFRAFLSCHDVPEGFNYPWLEWCSMAANPENSGTKYWKRFPINLDDLGERIVCTYGSKIQDSGRKGIHSVIKAGQWAYRNGLKDFWIMRMDSDDMLAKRTIETIHALDKQGIEAIYNRRCHIFDARTREIGEYNYRSSTTCNALKMRIEKNILLRWFYLCTNHTRFISDVRRDKIKFKEVDWTYCIVTNSRNSISSRPTLTAERWARKIGMTKKLSDRYGLDQFGR